MARARNRDQLPSIDKLREYLEYDPETGSLKWKISPQPKIQVGSEAGRLRSNGYVYVGVFGTYIRKGRLVWALHYGEWPDSNLEIDHWDKNKSNDRIKNLRELTPSDNSKNKNVRADNISGVTGVRWDDRKKRWRVSIIVSVGEKSTYVGRFTSLLDAALARRKAELTHWGHTKITDEALESLRSG